VKNILSTHIIYYKADHKKVFFFEKGPPTETAMFRCFAFKGAPTATALKVICFQKGPQQLLKCVNTLPLKFIERAPKATVVCNSLLSKGPQQQV